MNHKLVLEVLILGTGIYFFLRFLQATRGGGVLRGLVVMFVVGFFGLVLVGELLNLEELQFIIGGITPYVAVIFTILFQPELRKAIARLGEHNRLVRLLGTRVSTTVHEVVQAAIDMAARRQGALIAFQRDTPLEPYIQNAVMIDAEVKKLLLDGIFHAGSALHDGAVVIVSDRIAAAACIFPLTENPSLGKSVGTRHRAALGLTEETDAVVLVVSEETGAISVAHDGQLDKHISPERLEAVLLERLGYDLRDPEAGERRRPRLHLSAGGIARGLRALFFQDPLRKLAALSLAAIAIFVSHGRITLETPVGLQILRSDPSNPAPRMRLSLEIRLPSEDYVLVSPTPDTPLEVQIFGTRGEVDAVKNSLTGILTIGADLPPGGVPFPFKEVLWTTAGQGEVKVAIRWKEDEAPRLEVERYDEHELPLETSMVRVDDRELNRRLQVLDERIRFTPDSIEVRGPSARIQELREGRLSPLFEVIRLTKDDKSERTVSLRLSQELARQGLTVIRNAQAIIEIIPTRHTLEGLVKEIEIIPDSTADQEGTTQPRWTIQGFEDRATFDILTTGIIPDNVEPGQQAFTEISGAIRRYVETNLEVVARVRDLRDQEGDRVPVISFWPPSNWRSELSERLGTTSHGAIDEFAELDVVLKSTPRVLLMNPDKD